MQTAWLSVIEIGPGPVGVPVGSVKNERVEVVRRRHTSFPTGGATPAAPAVAAAAPADARDRVSR